MTASLMIATNGAKTKAREMMTAFGGKGTWKESVFVT